MLSRTTLAISFATCLLMGQAVSALAMGSSWAPNGEASLQVSPKQTCDYVNDLSGCSKS